MPKLYTHSRFIDLEFRNAYKKLNKQHETLVGQTGADGPDGTAGIAGAPGTLKVLTKYLVTTGYLWRVGFDNVALKRAYTGTSPFYWKFLDEEVYTAHYLERDYFIKDVNPTPPIFQFDERVLIQRVMFHLIEPFYAHSYFYTPQTYGLLLTLYHASQPNYQQGTLLAYSGSLSKMYNQDYYNDIGLFTPPLYNPLDRLLPKPPLVTGRFNEFDRLQENDGPDIISVDNTTHYGRALGTGPFLLEAGSKIVPQWPDTFVTPGYNGPVEGSSHGPFDFNLLPEEYFPLGGGCISITIVYHEV